VQSITEIKNKLETALTQLDTQESKPDYITIVDSTKNAIAQLSAAADRATDIINEAQKLSRKMFSTPRKTTNTTNISNSAKELHIIVSTMENMQEDMDNVQKVGNDALQAVEGFILPVAPVAPPAPVASAVAPVAPAQVLPEISSISNAKPIDNDPNKISAAIAAIILRISDTREIGNNLPPAPAPAPAPVAPVEPIAPVEPVAAEAVVPAAEAVVPAAEAVVPAAEAAAAAVTAAAERAAAERAATTAAASSSSPSSSSSSPSLPPNQQLSTLEQQQMAAVAAFAAHEEAAQIDVASAPAVPAPAVPAPAAPAAPAPAVPAVNAALEAQRKRQYLIAEREKLLKKTDIIKLVVKAREIYNTELQKYKWYEFKLRLDPNYEKLRPILSILIKMKEELDTIDRNPYDDNTSKSAQKIINDADLIIKQIPFLQSPVQNSEQKEQDIYTPEGREKIREIANNNIANLDKMFERVKQLNGKTNRFNNKYHIINTILYECDMFKKSYKLSIDNANQFKPISFYHRVLKDKNNKFLNEFKYHEKLKTLNDIEGIQPVGDPTNIHHSSVANSLVSAVEEKAEAVEAAKVEKSSKQTEEVRKRAKELLIKTNNSLKKMKESLKNLKEFKQKEPKQNMHLSQKLSQPSSPRPSSPRSVEERQKDAIKEHVMRMSVDEEFKRLLKKPSTVEQRITKLNDLQNELTAISKVMNVKSPKYKNMNTLWNSIKNLIDDLIVNINHPKYDTKYNYIIENMNKLRGQISLQGGRRTHKKHKIAKYKTRKNHISK
jgi:hypothetical protein